MTKTIVVICALLAGLPRASEPMARQEPVGPAIVPITRAFGLVFVELTWQRGTRLLALLDTGANASAIDPRVSQDLPAERTTEVTGTTGTVGAEMVSLPNLHLGALSLPKLHATRRDLSGLLAPNGRRVDMILGSDAFAGLAMTLDFPQSRLEVGESVPTLNPASVSMVLDNGIPSIPAELGGIATMLRIDTGASLFETSDIYVNVPTPFWDSLRLRQPGLVPRAHLEGTGADGKTVPLAVVRVAPAVIGGLRRDSVFIIVQPVAGYFASPQALGFVGNNYLDKLGRVTLDFARGRFIVEPGPTGSMQSARSGNPILPGWYADPEAHVFGGEYWIYPTYSAPYDQQTFMDAFSSRDLITWTRHRDVLDTANVSWAKRAVWAPSVIEKNGWYYLFFGANDIQNDRQKGGIGVARSRSPAGPFKDLIGKPLIDAFHNGAQPIDQMVFKDQGGAYYIVYGGWEHCNIAKLNDTFTGLVPLADGTSFKEITPKGYVEGAYMLLKDGKYYFMWSEGGWTGPDYAVAYAVGSSPFGPFERVGKILQQDSTVATGAGHHSILHAPGSANWYIVYHRRPLGETDRNHRVVSIDELRFDAQGRIQPVKITAAGVAADPVSPGRPPP